MPHIVRYLTHPQVLMEPLKDIRAWSLNEVGSNRVASLAAQFGSLSGTRRVVGSDVTKALETATPLASALRAALEVRPRMHENDRSATGFLPPQEFEAVADQFFAEPAASMRGWETAEDVQRRIVAEVEACLAGPPHEGDILFVGHGGVGTLLFCACLASVSTGASIRAREVAGAGSPSTPSFENHNADGSRWKPY